MIKTKQDAKQFLESIDKENGFQYHDGDLCYNGSGGNTIITPCEYGFEEFSWGQGWQDSSHSYFTKEEEIDRVWKDRKWINKTLKLKLCEQGS